MAYGKEPPRCRYKQCNQIIDFKQTKYGNWMPVNPHPIYYYPDKNGNGTVLTDDGRIIRALVGNLYKETIQPGDKVYIGYVPHWVTCRGAKLAREYERRSKAEERRNQQKQKEDGKPRASSKHASPVPQQLSFF